MKNFSLISHQDSVELVYNENDHITGVTYIQIDRDESIAKPHLSHHFVVFVLKGKIKISCKDYNEKIIGAGHMTFLSKGGFLQVTAHGVNSSLLFFGFDEITIRTDRSLQEFFTAHANKDMHTHTTLPVKEDMKHIVDRMVTQVRKGKIKNGAICQAWHIELFITFVTYYTKTQVTEFFRPIISTDISFRDFVENNYAEVGCSASKLIQLSGMPKHIFNKRFKEEYGVTPKVWMEDRFKRDLQYYASLPNITTKYLAGKLQVTVIKLCKLTSRLYGLTPGELISRLSVCQLNGSLII